MVVAGIRPAQLVQGQAAHDLWLRVVGSQRDGQVVRLTAPKCTIGSAVGCTLRLRAAGVRAVQCLVLRGARGNVARSCHADTRLNGHAFVDAALVAGDRLQVGPITLEVLDPPEDEQPFASAPAEPPAAADGPVRRERSRLERQRARKLIDTIRTLRSQLESFRQQSELADTERAAQHARELKQWADEHDRCTRAWHEERRQLAASREAEDVEHAERQAELAALEMQVAAEREAFHRQRAQLQAEDAAAHETLAEQHAALAEAQDALRQQRESHEQEHATQCSQLDRQREELDHGHRELAELRRRMAEERDDWQRQRAELEQSQSQTQGDVEQRLAQLESDRQAWQQTQQEHESRMQRECAALEAAREELRQQRGQHEAARAELDQRTAELAAELAARQTEYDARHEEHQRREQALNERAAGLDQRAAELGETESHLDGHRAELQEAQSGLEEARGELASAREALERTRAEIDQGRDELAREQAELCQARTQLDAEQVELQNARAAVADSQTAIASGFEHLLQGHEALEAARQQFGDEQRRHAEERNSRLAQQDEAEAAERLSRDRVEAALFSIHADRTSWAAELLAWETAQATLEEQLVARGHELATREEELAGLAEQLHALSERVAEAHNQEESLRAEREEFARQRERDESQLVERAEALERLAEEIESQRQRLQEDQATESKAAANEEQLAQVAELEQSLAAARQQLAEQQQQLEESLRRCEMQATAPEQLHGELEQQRAAFDEEHARWDETRQELYSSDADEIAESTAVEDEPPAQDFEEPQRWEEDAEPSGVSVEDTVKIERDQSYGAEAHDGTEEVAAEVDVADANMETQEFDMLRRSGASDEDKTIEECFAELLSRYRGQGGNVPEEPRQSVPRARRKSEASAGSDESKAATDPDATKPINVVDVATETVELQQRSSAAVPNYGAMREVARSHAKLAIDTHGQKRLVRAALVTSSAALATLLATIVVVAVLPGQHTALRSLANIGWVGAIFWVFVAGKAWQQVEAAKHADRTGLRQNIEQAGRTNSQ